jgi:hypothetical protein
VDLDEEVLVKIGLYRVEGVLVNEDIRTQRTPKALCEIDT